MAMRAAGRSWPAVILGGTLVLGALTLVSPPPALAGSSIDPLSGFNFSVSAGNQLLGYFTEVDGIGSESEVVEYKVVSDKGLEIVQKVPGRLKFLDVTLKRGITDDTAAWDWRKMVEDGDIKTARKAATITMYDRTFTPVAQWDFVSAWPSKISAPGLTSASGFAVEELTLVHEGYLRVTP